MTSNLENHNTTLSFLDFFAISPKLYVFGQNSIGTKFGVIMSLLVCLAIFALSGYFAFTTFNRSSITLVYNQDSTIYPVVNLTDYPLTLSLLDNYGQLIPEQETVFNFYLTVYNFLQYLDEQGNPQAKTFLEEIKLEKCDINKHFGNYKSYFADAAEMSTKYCLPIGKYNITLYGVYGNLKNGYNFLDIFVNRCVNNSLTNPNNNCQDITYIQNTLANSYLQIGYMDYDIDNKNEILPNLLIQRFDIIPLSSTVYKRIFNYKKPVQYKTDHGYVFEDIQTDYFFQDDRKESQVDLRAEGPFAGSFAEISILNSAKTDIYNRSYTKLQALLANVGGIIKGVMFMASIFIHMYSQKNLAITLFNKKSLIIEALISNDTEKPLIHGYDKLVDFTSKLKIVEEPKIRNKSVSKNNRSQSLFGINSKGQPQLEFRLKLIEMILPFIFLGSKPKYKIYDKLNQILKKTLSIDNLLEKINELESLTRKAKPLSNLDNQSASGNIININRQI
jgi:hypothetical protein